MIKRKWTAKEAEEWTKEDIIACILSIISYGTLMIGLVLTIFLRVSGYITLGIGILATLLMFYIIDPKLKAISTEYEKKEKEYLKEIEKIEEWEE